LVREGGVPEEIEDRAVHKEALRRPEPRSSKCYAEQRHGKRRIP